MSSATKAVDKRNGPRTGNQTWWSLLFRSIFSIYAWFSYDKMQAMSAIFILAPFIKANVKSKDELIEACKTNVQFFNTQPYMANFIYGICIAMIENHEPWDAIQAVKVGLMGPLAGIGDSLLWFTVRPILFSIGAGLALQGNIVGPLFAMLAFWFVQWLVRYHGMRIGYEQGTKFLETAAETGLMEELTNAISIVGITVVGCLVATWVRASTPLVLKAAGDTAGQGMKFQSMLDMLMPKLLPALFTWLAYWMLSRKRLHPVAVIFIFLAIGIIGSAAGVL